jgi:hypothetical protein
MWKLSLEEVIILGYVLTAPPLSPFTLKISQFWVEKEEAALVMYVCIYVCM